MNFTVDKDNKQINVERSFNAPKDLVWKAWTTPEILEQWWAPKPYTAITSYMDFTEGGHWHYYMAGPQDEQHWCLFDFEKIVPLTSFSGMDAFCDENAIPNDTKPRVHWHNEFIAKGNTAVVQIKIQFDQLEDLETIIEMGFREGFTAGLENLDQYIESQFWLRKENKLSNVARVSTYLNFDGNTEVAFNFYKSVFKTEFVGKGVQRFGDIPPQEGQPALADEVKKMILHVELPTLGGHILMGTDAPKEMGFTLKQGNNMHINLEPESREEAKRLFDLLSTNGIVDMPLQDMFWGAYYGSCTDKFGINWMINFQEK